MIKVSVIIIGYNTEKYIEKCIRSVMEQTLKNIEIICVDDGSTDSTFHIMKRMASQDKRIKIITQKNSGPYLARKTGLALARGEYLVFVDSDDWIDNIELEEAYLVCKKYNLDMVFFDYIKENNYTNKLEPNPLPLPPNRIIKRDEIEKIIYPKCMQNSNFSSPCTKMIRKDFVDSYSIQNDISLKYGEDLVFFLELYNNLSRTYYIPKTFYHYCIYSNDSLSRRHTKNAFFEIHKSLYMIRKPYAYLWGVQDLLFANAAYLGLGELIFDLRQHFELKVIKRYLLDDIFIEIIKNTDSSTLFQVSKSYKVVFLRNIICFFLKFILVSL